MRTKSSNIIASLALALAMTLALALGFATPALADESMEELQSRVEQSSTDYNNALEQVERLEADMQAQQGKIDEIEATLPGKRDEAAGAIRSLYKLQQSAPGLMGLILSSDDFNEFIALVQYFDIIQSKQISSVNELVDMQRELESAQDQLALDKAAADDQLAAAETALAEAQAARAEAQARAAEEAARQAAAAQAAIEAAQRAQEEAAAKAQEQEQEASSSQESSSSEGESSSDGGAVFPNSSGGEAEVEVPDNPIPEPADMATDDRSQFVAKWQPRIDAYLAGSPLGGYGRVFAEAAWDYGVDPRVSPAISCIESGKGAICFRPHNAWGWGSVSWGSWDSAIRGHVAGFASIYGYTLTPSGAEMYCPGTGGLYYSSVISQMSCI